MDIRFSSVTLHYADGTHALDNIGLKIPAGQFCIILGSSGAGKSTLLRTVNGLAEPTQGTVIVGGKPVERRTLPLLRRRIGMIHQHFGLTGRARVATNVIAGAAADMPLWRALTGIYPEPLRQRACAALEAVGLEPEHLLRRADQLSGGQQQRVGIARAFMRDPAIILADEPVASLDPRISRDILALLRTQAQAHGATVLCSLHQVDLAREFADRIVALQAGRVVFDGPAAMFDGHDETLIYARPGARVAPSMLEPAE
ncbi:phosphonate ABC transporter ATP-binding protein [Sphingobium aromaticiconvertens]|uniref:phosphonate ABC transporter ATP-binding protein n=1 Tax=Sphingobium aromaticiconvertens TaxID=365341 RepID=UPI0030183F61